MILSRRKTTQIASHRDRFDSANSDASLLRAPPPPPISARRSRAIPACAERSSPNSEHRRSAPSESTPAEDDDSDDDNEDADAKAPVGSE